MAFDRGAPTTGQQAELVVEASRDLRRRHRLHPRGGELDGKRDAVEPRTDLSHRGVRFVGRRERRASVTRALYEQRHGFTPQIERRKWDEPLTGECQSFAARGQHRHAPRGMDDAVHEPCDGVEQVLAVVEHEEELFRPQEVEQGLVERLPHAWLHPERRRECLDERIGVADPGELAEPRAVPVTRERVGGDLHREARLAHAADARDGDHPRVAERGGDVGQLRGTADEARGLERQVPRERVERPQRGKIAGKLGMGDLEDPLRPCEVPQAVLTEIFQAHAVGKPLTGDHFRCL